MLWDWGNIALALAAMGGLGVWVFQFYYMAKSERSVPAVPWEEIRSDLYSTSNPREIFPVGNPQRRLSIIKRLAVIRGSALLLLEDKETEDIKREMCRFIVEESEDLTFLVNKS